MNRDQPTGRITVRDVLEVGSWQLSLVAGEAGLERQVEWAHVFDIGDPSGWLDGGEMVLMSGRGWPSSGREQAAFVQQLSDAGASALGLGLLTPDLTRAVIDRANELAFPVLRVPRETGYMSIVKFVAAANGGSLQKNLVNSLRVFESLSPDGEETDALERFQQIERITGYDLTIITRSGLPLFDGMSGIEVEQLRHVHKTNANVRKWKSLAIPDGFAAPLNVGGRLAGFIVAKERESSKQVSLSVFRAAEAVARLEIGTLYREREATRRHRAELLGRYLRQGAAAPSEEEQKLLAKQGHFLLAAVRINPAVRGLAEFDNEIHHGLADEQVWHLLAEDRDRLIVVLGESGLGQLGAIVDELPVQAGVSTAFSALEDAPLALREASWALEYGQFITQDGKLRNYPRESAHWAQWLPSDPAVLWQLVKNTLGPLQEYDQRKGTDLVPSLRMYFEKDCRLQVAADQLFIHKHTLAYRLKRVEAVTGRDINSVSDRSVLWLALSALSVISMFPEANELG